MSFVSGFVSSFIGSCGVVGVSSSVDISPLMDGQKEASRLESVFPLSK